jgi:hypothetical protein
VRLVPAIAVACLLAGAALAQSGRAGWDGTWIGGWDSGNGVQLIFAGDTLIGFYWRGDYQEVQRSAATPDGNGRTFAWATGEATLSRDAGGNPLLVIRERSGKVVSVPLKHQ